MIRRAPPRSELFVKAAAATPARTTSTRSASGAGGGGGATAAGGGQPKHPGKITFVDANTGKENVLDVAQVPPALRFAATAQGQKPIVRVVATTTGDKRTIQEYGTGGALLRSTVQLKRT